jgi:CspA family cold shock protein
MGRGKDFRDRRRGYSDEPPEPPPSFGRPPPRSFDRPPREASRPVPTGPERQAKVKWFNSEKGFGFVELTDGTGEAFLHISVVEAAGHSALDPGTTLTTRVGQGAKGPQITEITNVDASTAEPSRRPAGRPMDRPSRGFDRPPTGPAEEVDGQVKWYDPKKGFGFVAVAGSKDVFIHRSVLAREGISELQEGQRIHMKVVPGAKGLEATSVEIKHDM